MRIIRLQVECRQDEGYLTRKYAVGLDPKHHRKVGSFIKYIKKLCQLGDHQYHLELNGFLISNRDITKALKDYHIYHLRLSLPPSINSRNNDEYQLLSSLKSSRNQKKRMKKSKILEKKPSASSISSSKYQSSSSQQQQRWSSSDSSSEQQVQLKKKTPIMHKKKENSTPKQQISDPKKKKHNQSTIVNNNNQNKRQNISKNKQSSSDSESSSSLALINKIPNKTQPLKQVIQKQALPPVTKIVVGPKETIKPKLIIQKQVIMDDSSESDPSESSPEQKKAPIKAQKPNNQSSLKGGQFNKSKQITSKPQMKIPPALRNKIIPKKSLEDHKQNQWITITKQLATKWLQTGEKYICQPNNQIRFKIIQLDQQRFVPVTSGWIKGNIKSVDSSNGSVVLSKVEEQRKPYRQTYQICEHNMNQLQINRLLATPQQLACFICPNQPSNVVENKVVHHQEPKQDNQQAKQDKNSVEKYVCGQVNYYFSDKSYNTDLFTQMHALRHPQKYLNLKFLLNFPKIKKVLRDEDKLYTYLKDDDKYNQRNYEIDFQNKLIRKKGLKIEKKAEDNGEDQNAEENRKEFIE